MEVQKAVLRIGKLNSSARDSVDYYDMPVQYNPSSLSFSSRAGLIEEDGPGEAGIGTHMSAILPPETTLSFDLIFEAIETEDAFLSYTKQQSIAEALGKKRISSADNKTRTQNNECSVQRQVDGLLSLVMQVATKQVEFVWGGMSFKGELEDVNAEYTMFNAKGNQILAKVSLSICQAQADSDNRTNTSEETYWEDAWKKFVRLSGKREEKVKQTEQYESTVNILKLNI